MSSEICTADICCDTTESNRIKILKVLKSSDIKCTKLIAITTKDNNTLFRVHVEEGFTKLFSTNITDLLSDVGQFIEPRQNISGRTIVVKSVDQHLLSNYTTKELIDDIQAQHENIKVSNMLKFPNGKAFKIQLEDVSMANRLLQTGMFLKDIYIPPTVLSIEKSNLNKFCYRCYSRDHLIHLCRKPQTYKICSTCSTIGHRYNECRNPTKCCITCNGSHHTLSNACKQANNINKPSQAATYSTKISANPPSHPINDPSQTPTPGITREDSFRGFMCLLYATNLQPETPEKFELTLNTLLKANSLPTFHTANLHIPISMSVSNKQGSNNPCGPDHNPTKDAPTPSVEESPQPIIDTASKEEKNSSILIEENVRPSSLTN